MNTGFNIFREKLFQQGIFSITSIRIIFPGFNTDNLLSWQKKGYILKIRNGWYCFKEFLSVTDHHFLIANNIYQPSYVSHQEALSYYGLIPEHIVNSVSISTNKTQVFNFYGKVYKYYSVKPAFFFGYCLKNMTVNGENRNFMIAEKEKAILDLLYIYDFYRTAQDLEEIRFNEQVLQNDIDWKKMDEFLKRFGIISLEKKILTIKKIYNI
ncbi:MAG: hypothetical protein A2W91_15800 [Bacteroidetes bacterium GWF2_38_335]|nr:MAG: hypothetical protein A2W91_15800 [Bacteroidetes bacterium GWF2_38_335]HBS85269.1 hypothetical protein [Bacteroidales bacterium]